MSIAQEMRVLITLGLPTILLMCLAVGVTRGVERFVPETLPGLVALAMIASGAMWVLASGLFAGLYVWQDARLTGLLGQADSLRHFAGLGLKSALIWAPVVLLVAGTAPRRWKNAVW